MNSLKENLILLTYEKDGFDGVSIFDNIEEFDSANLAKEKFSWCSKKLFFFAKNICDDVRNNIRREDISSNKIISKI